MNHNCHLANFQMVEENEESGDCGVYALKYIECKAIGCGFEGLSDQCIPAMRIKLAAEIYDEVLDEQRRGILESRRRTRCLSVFIVTLLRERPQWVALRGRSGLRFVSSRHGNASDLGASLWQVALRGVSHDRNASDLSMSLWLDRYGMCVTATSRRRSGEVALVRCSSVDRFKHFF
ncbi:hypothetical protein DY000_02045219 [Brassica cretica]|uniref:Ubiquitin-like protease family profile domain-containing protein n=1 Tax=Brassica cretica TaxID=69181 RepID=A0ABQ7F610_BRACR|nr:hypothetical protein DY000_02045219 [Brassica cretica]